MPCLLALAGCEKEIEVHPSPAVTQAVFDPGASPPAVPTPTDLVKNPDTGLLNVPVADPTTSPAQNYFDLYLNTLTGYPTSAVAEVRFDNELDGKTVGKDTIPVFDITSTPGTPVRLTDLFYDFQKTANGNCASPCLVRIWNYAGWKRGTTYVGFVIGGPDGVKDKDGKPVVRSATFELVTGSAPLCAWNPNSSIDAAKGCVLPAAGAKASGCCTFNYSALIDSQVKAKVRAALAERPIDEVEAEVKRQIIISSTQLERVRQGYGALLAMLAPAQGGWMSGLKRDDVALLWNWTTVSGNEAVFDPAAAPAPRVPTPNDLAINPATGLLVIPTAATASPAEKEFNDYLSSLNGYPTSVSSSTLEVIGDIDPATLAGNIQVYTVSSTGLTAVPDVTATYDGTSKRLLLTLKGGFAKHATTYAIFALGGDKGLKGTNGRPLQRSALMALALSPHPLCTFDATTKKCSDVKVSSFIDDPTSKPGAMTGVQKATLFEQMRQKYDPVMKAFSFAATTRKPDDVAALWTITTHSMTEVITDPVKGVIPFPNNLLMDPAKLLKTPPEYQVKLPETPGETPSQKALREQLNTFDGFGTQGPAFAATSGPVDPASFSATSAIALNLDKLGSPAPMAFSFVATGPAIQVKPQQPLDEKTNYGIILISRLKASDPKPADTGSLRDDKGRRLVPSAFTVLTRNRHPLVENGKSTISSLDFATAVQAEAVRTAQKPLFDALELLLGVKREDVVAAWTFHTMTVTALLPQIRAFPWQLFGAVDANKPTWTGALGAPPTGTQAAIGAYTAAASFVSWNVLDEQGTGAFLPNPAEWPTKGKVSPVPLLVALPCQPGDAGCTRTAARPAAGWPVAVFAHGVNQGKSDALFVASALTAAGYAVVSFDFVYHGARAWCTKSTHCASGGTCDVATGKCSTSLVDTDSDGKPDASGARFLNAANPFAVRDATRQSVIDASALLRGIKLNAASALTGTGSAPKLLDDTKVYWVGVSLGSQIGTLVLATDSLPKAAVLHVPGAPFPELAFYAPRWADIKKEILTSQGVTEGSLGMLRLVNIFDWIYDPADSGNYAPYLRVKQLPDLVTTLPVPKKPIIVQLAEKDGTIPISFGQYFARAAGLDAALVASKLTYPGQEHGFLLEPEPDPKATQAAQAQAVSFLNNPTDDLASVCTPNFTAGTCP